MCNELVTVTHITSVPIKQLHFMLFFSLKKKKREGKRKKKKRVLSDSRVKGGDGSNQFHLMIDQFVRNADQLQMLHSSLRMWSSIQNSHLARLTSMTQEVFQETKKKKKKVVLGRISPFRPAHLPVECGRDPFCESLLGVPEWLVHWCHLIENHQLWEIPFPNNPAVKDRGFWMLLSSSAEELWTTLSC